MNTILPRGSRHTMSSDPRVLTEGRQCAWTPIWPWTSMRVGGPARWLVEATTGEEADRLLIWAEAQHVPVLILGGGCNVIVSDHGFPGLVLVTRGLRGIRREGVSVTAACGEPISYLAHMMNRAGLSGLEWAYGIPGTVGGAVAMNAGTRWGDVASALAGVRLRTEHGVDDVRASSLQLGYRTSALRTGALRGMILGATFRLREDRPERCIERARELLKARRESQPTGASAGCVFKNPAVGPPAGALLDRAGCKGLRVGDAEVSEVHANFIVNRGQQNAGDVIELVDRMQSRVREAYGLSLEREVEIVRRQAPSG